MKEKHFVKTSSHRYHLQERLGERDTFSGEFVRYGEPPPPWLKPREERKVLIRSVQDKNEQVVCDHLWIAPGKQIEEIGEIKPGDQIQFEATVYLYTKGGKTLWGQLVDYGLTDLANIRKQGGLDKTLE